jgi:FKBP-type peptidyl-prolyl cis-trans isomerase FkpA
MAEVTRVPIQPIAKGSVLKLWIGLLFVVLIAGGLAYWAMPKGVEITVEAAGEGPSPVTGDVVFVKYTGKLPDGTVFDKSQDLNLPIQGLLPEGTPMRIGDQVPGFDEALLKMKKGGKYVVHIPADKGYGANPPPGSAITPNSDLIFDVELVDFMSEADAQRRFQMVQQLMSGAQQQGGESAAGK